jgi:hypothetical protein
MFCQYAKVAKSFVSLRGWLQAFEMKFGVNSSNAPRKTVFGMLALRPDNL